MNTANQPLSHMTYEEIFDQSYERVKDRIINGRVFFQAFYDNFLAVSPEVERSFAATDMDRQVKMMEKSFYGLFIFHATQNANDYLETVAHRHSHADLNIGHHLFDLWLDALIETVKDYDPHFNDEIALSWRIILSPGVTYMKHRHSGQF
ncbi:MAG: globin [Gammaproteobacteria bacterium]|jgi:hemoglobin-like flavoprotein